MKHHYANFNYSLAAPSVNDDIAAIPSCKSICLDTCRISVIERNAISYLVHCNMHLAMANGENVMDGCKYTNSRPNATPLSVPTSPQPGRTLGWQELGKATWDATPEGAGGRFSNIRR